MRKIYTLFLVLTLQKTFSQNTFPTSGNVGIGTNTPTYLLDVNSSAQRLFNPTGTTTLRIEGNGTTNYAGSYIYLSAGTSRIGDTFTKARIDADRGTDSTSIFQYSRMNGDTYTGIFYQYGDLLGHRFFTPASRTATSTSEVFRISPEGHVGIGSTTLTNRGLALATPITGGTTSYGMLNNGLVKSDVIAGAYLNYSQLNTQATSFTLPLALHFSASEGTIGAGSSVTTQIGFSVSSNMSSATNNYGYRSAIPTGTNNWNLYLEGAANNFMAGALGVGTTSLVGNNFRVSKTITGSATSIGVRSDGQIQPDVTGAAYYYRSDASTAASTTTGNITHYFAYQLPLGSGSNVDTQAGFSVASNLTGAVTNYGFYGNIAAGTGRWNFYASGTANNFFKGNVGIGSTTINYPLHITTTGPYLAGFTRTSVGTGAIAISQLAASSTADIVLEGQQASSGVVLRSRDASNNVINSLAVDRNGNVGIGTLSPQSNLHLSADGPILSTTATNGASGLRVNVLGQTSGTAFRVQNAGNTIFQVDLNGSIGIGTGSTDLPSGYKLAIAGNVIAEKVKVKKQVAGAWPDYVFNTEYKLPSLEEVEQFTKQNNHLSEMPSAKEVEKEGQDLGEMNRLLLKKVEELTLYMIEQNKNIIQQNKEIKKQNNEIKTLKFKVEQLEKK